VSPFEFRGLGRTNSHQKISEKPRTAQARYAFTSYAALLFDVREDATLIRDEEGQVMANLDAVQEEAVEDAAAIARDALAHDQARAVTVEVSNAERQPVLSVTVSMEIKRH
jgi:hypothetical protein